jgi:hypothetical protein
MFWPVIGTALYSMILLKWWNDDEIRNDMSQYCDYLGPYNGDEETNPGNDDDIINGMTRMIESNVVIML